MLLRKRREEDDSLSLCYLLCIVSLLLASSTLSFCMEQKVTISIEWIRLSSPTTYFYYTLPSNTTIHTLKQKVDASLLNHEKLKATYMYLQLIVGNDHLVIQDSEYIGNLFDTYQSHKYKLVTFFNNKRKTVDPIDDPSLEIDEIPEPATKKVRRTFSNVD